MIIAATDTGKNISPSDGMLLTNGEIYIDHSMTVSNTFDLSKLYEVFPENVPSEDITDKMGQEFWNGFYKTERKDFSYAFVNSGAEYIVPPSPIEAKSISYMLMNCSELIDASGITVELTADKPTCVSICMGCTHMTKPPKICFSDTAHVVRSYVCAFTNCMRMTEAVVWLGDGTQSAFGERTDMANAFMNCSELQHLSFTGSGSPKNLDLSSCVKLTLASIKTLVTAIMNVTEAIAGTYDIQISNKTAELMTEELKTAFSDKGWTLKIKEEAEE